MFEELFFVFSFGGIVSVIVFLVTQVAIFRNEIKGLDWRVVQNWDKAEDTKIDVGEMETKITLQEKRIAIQNSIIEKQERRIQELERKQKNNDSK